MATEDVPGHNPAHRDVLANGCWAESPDGSLILVQGTEGGRVVYSLFDTAQEPVMEYRDAMREEAFKKAFSWKSGEAVTADRWTWHDKTPFDWDRVIKAGARPGLKYPSAADQLTAARRVAEALKLKAHAVAKEGLSDKKARKLARLSRKLEDALAAFPE